MNSARTPLARYVTIAAVVWAAIIGAVISVLKGTPYIFPVLPILLGGALIFVVIVPMAFRLPPTPPRRG
jgi:hypothetical protein